ncbi:MAG TPA: FAD-dependent oxidoreductase [Anaerolineae bacterium]|nr:FAD-dependent oxidoreductase [Anaerolineae bacterium]
MTERLVVIGGVAAGMSAAAKAKRARRDLEVVVYEKGGHISYAACGLPYFLAGDVPRIEGLIVRTPEQMAKQGVEVKVRHEVTSVDAEARTVQVHDLQADRTFRQDYDHLVIATGARPACPPLPGCELGGIFGLRSLESGLAIQQHLQEQKPKKALIVGGGYIGVEMAETLRRLGLEVTMLVRSGKVLRTTLDDDMRELVHAELTRHGVQIVEGPAVGFEGKEDVSAVQTASEEYACDAVILGLGAEPNVDLARATGVALGLTGAIATNSQMCTNLPGVYAAGDCAEALHRVTGKPAWVPLGSTANKQGRVAGSNAAGKPASFGGILGTMVVRCFDLGVGFTGLTAVEARAAGYDVQETKIQASDLSHYFPGTAEAHVKLVVDGASGQLLGGQLVGPHRAIKRIDVLVAALHNRMTVPEMQELDLSYAPPFSPVWDPILVAANVAAKD